MEPRWSCPSCRPPINTEPQSGSDVHVARDEGHGASLSPFHGLPQRCFIFDRVMRVNHEGFWFFFFPLKFGSIFSSSPTSYFPSWTSYRLCSLRFQTISCCPVSGRAWCIQSRLVWVGSPNIHHQLSSRVPDVFPHRSSFRGKMETIVPALPSWQSC